MKDASEFKIQTATANDIDQIVSFTQAIHQQEDDNSIPTHHDFLSNLKKWITSELNNPLSLFLLVKDKNESIGFIAGTTVINDNGFLENPTKGLVNLLWVNPEHRRKNIARLLLNNMEACFKENGINIIEVSYTYKNQLASQFWKKSGYKPHSLTARKFLEPH